MIEVADHFAVTERLTDQDINLLGDRSIGTPNYLLTTSGHIRRGMSETRIIRWSWPTAGRIAPPWLFPIIEQLNSLLALAPNWDSYGAPSPDLKVGIAAIRLLAQTMSDNTPLPTLIPLSTGGFQLEWHEQDIDLEVEANASDQFLLYGRDCRRGVEWEATIGLNGGPLRDILRELAERSQATTVRAG